MGGGSRRERLAGGLIVMARTGANHRTGRTVGVGSDFKARVLMAAVTSHRVTSHRVTAERADVPSRGDDAQQRQQHNCKLREARRVGQPLARRQEDHVHGQYQELRRLAPAASRLI